MDTSGLKLFSAMKQKLAYMSERQKILSQNIANANTPGYKAKDINADFKAVLQNSGVGGLGMKQTDPGHMSGNRSGGSLRVNETESSEITPNGNNVVLEEQVLKMQENNLDYQATTDMYKKMTQILRSALGDGR